MNICPICAIGDCPYCHEKCDEYGEYDCYCELADPAHDCDDYATMMGGDN